MRHGIAGYAAITPPIFMNMLPTPLQFSLIFFTKIEQFLRSLFFLRQIEAALLVVVIWCRRISTNFLKNVITAARKLFAPGRRRH